MLFAKTPTRRPKLARGVVQVDGLTNRISPDGCNLGQESLGALLSPDVFCLLVAGVDRRQPLLESRGERFLFLGSTTNGKHGMEYCTHCFMCTVKVSWVFFRRVFNFLVLWEENVPKLR